METKESVGYFDETHRLYQRNYLSLLAICDAEGTMILQDRVLENDKKNYPHCFFRKGTREYVFPQQPVSLFKDNSYIVDHNPDYAIVALEHKFNFNPALVKGRIRIEYQDSNNKPAFRVIDVLGNSEIPEAVRRKIDIFFG